MPCLSSTNPATCCFPFHAQAPPEAALAVSCGSVLRLAASARPARPPVCYLPQPEAAAERATGRRLLSGSLRDGGAAAAAGLHPAATLLSAHTSALP